MKEKSKRKPLWWRAKDSRIRSAMGQINDYYESLVEHHLRQTLRDVFAPVADGYDANGQNVWVVERDETLVPTESGKSLHMEGWEFLNLELRLPLSGTVLRH